LLSKTSGTLPKQDIEFELLPDLGCYDNGLARQCHVKDHDGNWVLDKAGNKVLVGIAEKTGKPMPSMLRQLKLMDHANRGTDSKKRHDEKWFSTGSAGGSSGSAGAPSGSAEGWQWKGSGGENGCGMWTEV
jgi:hypothetical protein